MRDVFAPGCALMIYKPHMAQKLLEFLSSEIGDMSLHLTCCRHDPRLPRQTRVVNVCAGCDRRYSSLYEGISTVSLWEILARSDSFPFPDHGGIAMSIQDACPTRTEERVHNSVRELLKRMNIAVVEPEHTRLEARCCGDSLYQRLPVPNVKDHMRRRADEMPCDEVAVYCVSCIKSMHIGGRRPRYIPDLLFNEETLIGTFEPDEWHRELDTFIDAH